ncbi:TrlF family AAA-like ATPase [Candidatus Enterococcus ikei]|uniref:TrlF family AAA-like ATPase n=1 Tax=Candidatus Enterococcus ikei TaxID=2815326 RepID=UPI001F5C2215|nr:hypothetical protein [Enterococcus sp. DIV0869a]
MFNGGTEWVRADFHLHTKADKEFSYTGEADRFISDYVEKLKSEEIKLGVITNHNKFDFSEYKGIKRKASKEDIMILPGVELSVKEGSNGVHCLVVFKESDWITGGKEFINQFLDEVFKNIDNRENENTRCKDDLPNVIKCLNSYGKEYFILMAHIEQKSGFLSECSGGLIGSLSKNMDFKTRVLGFQKGRTRDKMAQLKQWMGYELPYVEGSDCKSISDIGKGEKSFIKIGDNCYDSVVLAFKDFKNRISLKQNEVSHGYIRSIEFLGGKLNGEKIYLSPELNSLIGIRGSGKSSIIEAIRYALDLEPSESDGIYKKEVVENLLVSGGQIILEVQDNFGNIYKIKRILGENPHILDMNDKVVGAKMNTILNTPLYFGQKDLSAMDNGFELKLLDKLVGKREKISEGNLADIENDLVIKIKELIDLEDRINNIDELKKTLQDIRYKINVFEEHGLSEKLSKQVNIQKDRVRIERANTLVQQYLNNLESILVSNDLKELSELEKIKSKEVPELLDKLSTEIVKVTNTKSEVQKIITSIKTSKSQIDKYVVDIQQIIDSLEEEFAEIKRQINIPNLNPDDFSKLKINEERVKETIKKISKQEEEKEKIINVINGLMDKRNQALISELEAYKHEIDKINSSQSALDLTITFKGNKDFFLTKMREFFKGTGIKNPGYESLANEFSDFASLITDILLGKSEKTSKLLSDSHLQKIKQKIRRNYESLIKVRTPNQIEIKYHGKPIIKHSIGQRASALVLFILSQKENNLIMIDQPEDDLDNQVIYNEIIREIKNRKTDVQFIFATHNANIPVLGDSEQIITVSYDEKKIDIQTGSVDNKLIQNKIVDIMEGGQEAFNKRTEIYNLWKNY